MWYGILSNYSYNQNNKLFKSIQYCKFGNFRENFIFANSVKRHICDVINMRIGQDLPILVNDRVISPFPEGLIFTKFWVNKTLANISELTV